MIEQRKSPRANVSWRGAIKVAEDKIIAAKVINVSQTGVMFLCEHHVDLNKEYECMMMVPGINSSGEIHQVLCRVSIMHAILSDGVYKIGVKFVQISELHRDLLSAWLSLLAKS